MTARFSREDLMFLGEARGQMLRFAELTLHIIDLHQPGDGDGLSTHPSSSILRCRSCMWRWPCPTFSIVTEVPPLPREPLPLPGDWTMRAGRLSWRHGQNFPDSHRRARRVRGRVSGHRDPVRGPASVLLAGGDSRGCHRGNALWPRLQAESTQVTAASSSGPAQRAGSSCCVPAASPAGLLTAGVVRGLGASPP